jgi:hypothetical protein
MGRLDFRRHFHWQTAFSLVQGQTYEVPKMLDRDHLLSDPLCPRTTSQRRGRLGKSGILPCSVPMPIMGMKWAPCAQKRAVACVPAGVTLFFISPSGVRAHLVFHSLHRNEVLRCGNACDSRGHSGRGVESPPRLRRFTLLLFLPFFSFLPSFRLAIEVGATLTRVQCAALAADKQLHGKVLAPDSAEYNAQLNTYYSANAAQHAWCMVLPESTADVQAVVKVLTKEQCPFGIKAGGHSAWKGSNGIAEGVTVDFGYMNATSYNPDTGIVSIQPGARWGSVYELLNQYNVTVVGARTSVVGVGGFTTGGGVSVV